MKRILFIIVSLLLLTSNAFAFRGQLSGPISGRISGGLAGSSISNIPAASHLTFFKDFTKASNVNADFAVGSIRGTFTRSTDATHPATYTDSNGVIQLVTTSNQPRFAGGYYDATGFHAAKGYLVEVTSTNLVPKSYTMNDATWTATDITPVDGATSDPAGGTNAASLTATGANGTILLASAVTARSYSVYLKRKTGTGTIQITANGGTTWTTVVLTSEWCRFSTTRTSASQTCGIKIVSSGDAVYVYGSQFEDLPYPTTLIPTTNGALTRNADILTYPISGNRTASEETIAIKFMPMGGDFANDSINRRLMATDTKDRSIRKNTTASVTTAYSNGTDSSGSNAASTTTSLKNVSYVYSSVFKHTSPYVEVYMNGVSEGTDTDDFTDPAWGTKFYISSSSSGLGQLNGLIQAVAIHRVDLGAKDILTISNIMASL